MLRETIKSVMLSQREWITPEVKEIPRELVGRFSKLHPFTYILTGVRRSGKSTLLRQIMREHGSVNYFNFEDSRLAGFDVADFLTIEELFSEVNGSNALMFFDEIQNVAGWERYVRDAMDRKKKILIAGSNANLLSRELGTKLTGRHLDFEVFPFSYNEFLKYFTLKPGRTSFVEYMDKGGFPAYLSSGYGELLSTLVSDILVRDIYSRYNLRNQDAYGRIVQFLLSNTGKEVSFNNIKNTFEIGSASSVMDFMNYLADCYLIFPVPLYNHSLKVQARNPRKVYTIDQGLARFCSVSGSPDRGRLLENAVFLHLRRLGMDVWYYRGKRECDFVCRSNKNKWEVMQVSWELGLQNEKREVEGILEAMDYLGLDKGTIITFDQEDKINKEKNKITLLPAWKWMSQ